MTDSIFTTTQIEVLAAFGLLCLIALFAYVVWYIATDAIEQARQRRRLRIERHTIARDAQYRQAVADDAERRSRITEGDLT